MEYIYGVSLKVICSLYLIMLLHFLAIIQNIDSGKQTNKQTNLDVQVFVQYLTLLKLKYANKIIYSK